MTPTVAGEPAVKLSKLPYGVRKSRSKNVPSPRGMRTSFTGPLPSHGAIVYVLPGAPTTFSDGPRNPSSPSIDPWLWRSALLPIVLNGSS